MVYLSHEKAGLMLIGYKSKKNPLYLRQPVTSTLTIVDERHLRSATSFRVAMLDGFSPYAENNQAPKVKCAVFEWREAVTIDFVA